MSFEPIAVVGQSCVLPGALNPAELWQGVAKGHSAITAVPPSYWRVEPTTVMTGDRKDDDRAYSDRGGYVRGFETIFDASGFALAREQIAALDPLAQWLLHCGREALRDAGITRASNIGRAGAVIGNLSYPSHSLSELAEGTWLDRQGPDFVGGRSRNVAGIGVPAPENRFMSGLPAHLLAQGLGLSRGAFCLDAACASSLYALALCCDELQERRADLMLAGGVNRADDLFIHVGFCALQAMSPTGRSQPFCRDADGLVPAEGAAFVALERLDDAVRHGRNIVGVIRGIGLANDGRGRGMLVPSQEGQVRALRRAYASAGLEPTDISLVECHATGTPIGDLIEINSMLEVFAGCEGLPIGSLKSNLGHLITASGVAGLQKVLAAMKAGIRPKSLHADALLDILVDNATLRVLSAAEPWTVAAGTARKAAISNFGFGGNDAHVIVEQYDPATAGRRRTAVAVPQELRRERVAIAIVGIEVLAGDGTGIGDFTRDLFGGSTRVRSGADGSPGARADHVDLPLLGLRFPPADLAEALPQQIYILKALHSAMARREAAGRTLPRETTGVLVGMQCDTEVAAYGARLRMADCGNKWAAALGADIPDGWLDAAKDAVGSRRGAAGVIGAMPNIPANRLCSQFDLAGPSFTVSAEELSGIVALDLGVRALQKGDMDAMVVGAVDMSCEWVHRNAAVALLPEALHIPGDAAVILILEREADARRDGEEVFALVDRPALGPAVAPGAHLELRLGFADDSEHNLVDQFGHAHAASGLLHVAAAALACHHRMTPRGKGLRANPWLPDATPDTATASPAATVSVSALGGPCRSVELYAGAGGRDSVVEHLPALHLYAGGNATELRARVAADESIGEYGAAGPIRLAILCTAADLAARRHLAGELVREATAPVVDRHNDIFFYPGPVGGDVALVFTGPAGAYHGMGRELLSAFPSLLQGVYEPCLEVAARWIYEPTAGATPPPASKLWGSSLLSQFHAALTQRLLGITPQAAIGFCSGESNSLFALGAWRDVNAMFTAIRDQGVFTREIGGEFRMLERAWSDWDDPRPITWVNWRVFAPEDTVAAAVADERYARLTIINAPGDVVIGGDPQAIDRVVEKIGRSKAVPIGYDVALHCSDARAYEGPWYALHHRETFPVPGVRFYTASTGTHYQPTSDSAAEAITLMSQRRVDFPRMIHNAYADGVRVFIEHGPRDGCAKWIGRILDDGERDDPYACVALDRGGESPLEQLLRATAQLWAAGVEVDHAALTDHLAAAMPPSPTAIDGPIRAYAAHSPVQRLPPMGSHSGSRERPTPSPRTDIAIRAMAQAPPLPPVAAPSPMLTRPSVGRGVGMTAGAPAQQSPAAAATMTGAPMAAVGPVDALAGQLARQHSHMATAHQAFMQEQARVQAQFANLRQTAMAQLVETVAAQPTSALATPAPFLPATPNAEPPGEPSFQSQSQLAWSPVEPPPRVAFATPPTSAKPAAPVAEPTGSDAKPRSTAQTAASAPVGRTFTREELGIHASGNISELFGEQFAIQDDYPRQTRMPEKALLLADRVVGLDAEPGSMAKGTVWTETDVGWDAWYLNYDGSMPAGLVVEAGQADLFLISFLGADFRNKGERVYRLLGCEATYEGGCARPGDTLQYEIKVVGHAKVGPTRLFFFQYDGRINGELRMKVRNGQAGFFTDAEMANSMGVLWSADDIDPTPDARVDPPAVAHVQRELSREGVRAIADGKIWETLGVGFEMAAPHTRTPRIQSGKMLLLERVVEIDPTGGPWGRGYMRIENDLDGDAWYLDGHFKNDPCMPGTLMCEGCLQAMSLYMIMLGYTLQKDGWIFEPVPHNTYDLKCRGQVSTNSKQLTYEIFIDEIIAGPVPTIYADILGTADGLKIFHGRRMGLALSPSWPINSMPRLLEGYVEPKTAVTRDGFTFDYKSLIACAWGRPTDAFGDEAEIFCGTRHIARLPGIPYHFMSRVTRLDADVASTKNAYVEVEYDIPPDAWYFAANGNQTLPFCAILEIALQPCGWLSVFIGTPAGTDIDLYFRNLDGKGTVHAEVRPDTGTLLTKAKLRSFSHIQNVVLVSFDVEVWARDGTDNGTDDTLVYSLDTGFGYFPLEAFAMQPGLAATDEERAWATASADSSDFHVDLRTRPARYCEGSAALADPMLLMLDEVTGYWPGGGSKGLGKVRAIKHVNPAEWFFKAHFFQDPVQPGSLGCEAMLQLLQWWMLHTNQHAGMSAPRFEPAMLADKQVWKYRGQITPKNQTITLELDVLESGRDARGVYAKAEAWVWVDGLRIYDYTMGMRLVDGAGGAYTGSTDPHPGPGFFPAPREAPDATWRGLAQTPAPMLRLAGAAPQIAPAANADTELRLWESWESEEEVLDPCVDTWLQDHCPTYTFPSLPMMSVADWMARATLGRAHATQPAAVVTGLEEVRLTGWLMLKEPQRLKARVTPTADRREAFDVTLLVWREAADPKLSRWEPKAEGRVTIGDTYTAEPAALTPVTDGVALPGPYETARIFHGPTFHLLERWQVGAEGSTAYLEPTAPNAPFGLLNQVLLDAAVHGIVHDELWRWCADLDRHQIAYPYRVESVHFFGPAPTESSGAVRCETRFAGFHPKGERFPRFRIQMITAAGVWLEMFLVEILMPVIEETADRLARIRYIRDKEFFPGKGACTFAGDTTRLHIPDLRKYQWLKDSMELIFDIQQADERVALRHGVIKEHVSQRAEVHPYFVTVAGDEKSAYPRTEPLRRYYVETVEQTDEDIVVRESATARNDFEVLREVGRLVLGGEHWPPEDLLQGMMQQFVRHVRVTDPRAIDALAGQPKLLVANHQVQVESAFAPFLLAPLLGGLVTMIANDEHRRRWIGKLDEMCCSYPGVAADSPIVYFDKSDRESLFQIMEDLERTMKEEGRSVFLHVEGELARSCRTPVTKMSSVLIDWASRLDIPIVPVRFSGGLPVDELSGPLEFPLDYAAQDYTIGPPMFPAELAALPYAERRKHVMAAINNLGIPVAEETPNPPDDDFAHRVAAWTQHGLSEVSAVIIEATRGVRDPSPGTAAILRGLDAGELRVGTDPKDAWLAELARWIYGSKGPRVVVSA